MRRADGDWRVPELKRLGDQFRDLETTGTRSGLWRRCHDRIPRRIAASLAAAVILAVVTLEVVAPAGAHSPLREAPSAAERAGSLRFRSTASVTVNGHSLTKFVERGALNFLTGNYEAASELPDGAVRIGRRRVGGSFYEARLRPLSQRKPPMWATFDSPAGPISQFAQPGGFSTTDPQVVFRVLETDRAHVVYLGVERIGNEPTSHYRVATSLAALTVAEGHPSRTALHGPPTSAVMDVWLDSRGRPRRVKTTIAGHSRLGYATLATIVDFTNYGDPVTVTRPVPAIPENAWTPHSEGAIVDPLGRLPDLFYGER